MALISQNVAPKSGSHVASLFIYSSDIIGPINNIPALVQIMVWRRPGDKPLFEPLMVSLPTHICVTRPQWVNAMGWNDWFNIAGRLTYSLYQVTVTHFGIKLCNFYYKLYIIITMLPTWGEVTTQKNNISFQFHLSIIHSWMCLPPCLRDSYVFVVLARNTVTSFRCVDNTNRSWAIRRMWQLYSSPRFMCTCDPDEKKCIVM